MADSSLRESCTPFTCYQCPFGGDFESVVRHSMEVHSDKILKVRRREINEKTGRKGLKTLNFNIIPDIIKSTNKDILAINEDGTQKLELIDTENDDFGLTDLSLDDIPDPDCMSPFCKRTKTSTPHKVAQKTPTDFDNFLPDCAERVMEDNSVDSPLYQNDMEIMNEINRILPEVIRSLRNIDQLQNWLSFHKMVQEGRFPMENIAFHLFMDVCKFYSLGNTAAMRFSPIVKRFWRIGYCLFHGKWLHFMSGPKNLGQKIINPEEEVSSERAKINFAVPYRATVGSSNRAFKEDDVKPGLLTPMIDKLAGQAKENKTYKLCVDGKKINSGKSKTNGDIDLFGFEKSPTLSERKAELKTETILLKSISENLDLFSIRRKVLLKDLSCEESEQLVPPLLETLQIVSKKLRALRETKVNKELMLEKLKKQSGTDWRKSKFVYVISSLETDLYDVSNCIKELLSIVDEIGLTVATLRNTGYLYSTKKSVPLHTQSNYIHISSTCSEHDFIEPRKIKQQSEKWHEIRNSATVTGSSLNNALGLGSFKQQLEHFDKVFYKKEPKPFSSVVQMKMRYGSEQEINAIATLVGKVLPVFEPSLVYVEEGCFKKTIGSEPKAVPIVISPDGSLRKSQDSTALFGIECKCPFPGKTFTTPVFYKIPKYYVTQVLAEMYSMDCKELYFICYSEESSTIFKVHFCPDLWRALENEMVLLYGQERPNRPTKKSDRSVTLKKMVDKFEKENVKFVAEFPSILAEKCELHTTEIYCVHTKPKSANTRISVRDIQETIQKATVSINRAYELNRTRASEFLGFMVSDLDREYSLERYHAVPIAYGLKGYSLPTKTLRNMIEYVLQECWNKGLYIPVCCFDGQWFRMAVRDRYDSPLTLLQLQKDVYADAKKMSKGQIIKKISEINIVNLPSDVAPEDVIEIQREGTKLTLANGNKSERIVMTSRLVQLLKNSSDVDETISGNRNESENTLTDMVLSSLPDNYVNEIEEELVEEVAILASSASEGSDQIDSENNDQAHVETIHELFYGQTSLSDDHFMDVDTEHDSTPQHPLDGKQFEHVTSEKHEFLKALNTKENIILMLSELQSNDKNIDICLSELTLKLKSAESIHRSFTKTQIVALISPISGVLKSQGIKCNKSQTKYTLTNILSDIFGDGSRLHQKPTKKIKNPSSLKCLARKAVQKLPKIILNCVYAQYNFPKALEWWQNESPFGSVIQIEGFKNLKYTHWYSKPEFNDVIGSYLFVILDAYHQICGLRRVFCDPGIPKAGISSKPVHMVVENSAWNGSGLSIALVRDMIDKQSIAYAVQTFSESVEEALFNINAKSEAEFCNIVRNWYLSEDEPGLSAHHRFSAKLEFRHWLLKGVRFDEFPPYGSYVKDIPIVLYEGLLIGIERKLQLYPFTKAGAYNVRAVGSLDIENFFGSFQDIDPRGAGVLRPDDIPTAISVAMELLDARLDPERGFYLNTSRKRVYPSKEGMEVQTEQQTLNEWRQPFRDVSTICLRDHIFDLQERRRGKRSRKSGNVSKPDQPARNPFPVREYHKASEAKILPHVRRGLKLDSHNK